MAQLEKFYYDNDIVKKFAYASVVFGLVGMSEPTQSTIECGHNYTFRNCQKCFPSTVAHLLSLRTESNKTKENEHHRI